MYFVPRIVTINDFQFFLDPEKNTCVDRGSDFPLLSETSGKSLTGTPPNDSLKSINDFALVSIHNPPVPMC